MPRPPGRGDSQIRRDLLHRTGEHAIREYVGTFDPDLDDVPTAPVPAFSAACLEHSKLARLVDDLRVDLVEERKERIAAQEKLAAQVNTLAVRVAGMKPWIQILAACGSGALVSLLQSVIRGG